MFRKSEKNKKYFKKPKTYICMASDTCLNNKFSNLTF